MKKYLLIGLFLLVSHTSFASSHFPKDLWWVNVDNTADFKTYMNADSVKCSEQKICKVWLAVQSPEGKHPLVDYTMILREYDYNRQTVRESEAITIFHSGQVVIGTPETELPTEWKTIRKDTIDAYLYNLIRSVYLKL